MAIVLITGGSGVIGTALTRHLLSRNHQVRHLSRSVSGKEDVPTYKWNVNKGRIDDLALEDVEHIVHLAGAGIADERWTRSRIDELIHSRVASARLLFDRVDALDRHPRTMISAAGIGYYGALTSDHLFQESDPPDADIIGHISSEWERAVDEWTDICRVVKLRTPVVLAANGGALPKLVAPVKLGAGAPLGKGDQWMPWVHLHDLVRIYTQAIEDTSMEGPYNAGPLTDTTNARMMWTIASVLDKPFFLPKVPAFTLKLALGRMASVLLEGSRADDKRLLDTGFRFEYTKLRPALEDLLAGDQ